jgi:uncharacterized Zn finger protein
MARQTKTKPVFEVAKLRTAAGAKVFERGEDYYADGSVDILTFSTSRVTAQVTGTQPYFVDLAYSKGKLSGSCSCPAYVDHGFCKHMVATGLMANDHVLGQPAETDSPDTIENVLRSLDHEALVKLVIDIAGSDPKALHALSLKTAMISPADSDVPSLAKKLKREIKAATRVGEFIGYDEVSAWAARVEDLIDSIEGLLAKGHSALVMELADLLREQLNDAFEAIDDSDGQMGMLVSRAMQLHLAACRLACPDPVQLAKDLFAREMADDLEDTIETYADLLGDSGRQEMERLASAAWAKLRPPRTGVDNDDDGAWSTYPQLATMLDRFAADRGDLQARIDIRKRDLSNPGRYLDLAKLCEEHGRTDEAIKWVEDGLFIFEDSRDDRFVLYAADLFMRHGRAHDRSALLWRAFARSPSIDLHKKLVHNLKGESRVQVTDRAIELIRTRKPDTGRPRFQNDDDLVISILSSERRLDEAWTLAASAKCTLYCLEELAQASEKSHPRQALEVHQRRVTRLVQTGGNQNYAEAQRLIKRMRIIAKQGGEANGQATFESDLLAKHHAKRNFIKLMSGETAAHRIQR